MKNEWLDLIVDLIQMLPLGTEYSLDELWNKAIWKIGREDILMILVMGVQAGYIEAVWVNNRCRFCSTQKGRDYEASWYE